MITKILKYYAVDARGNEEATHQLQFNLNKLVGTAGVQIANGLLSDRFYPSGGSSAEPIGTAVAYSIIFDVGVYHVNELITTYPQQLGSLDAIAIPPGYILQLQSNGVAVFTITGPKVITNKICNGIYNELVERTWDEPWESIYPRSCRVWSDVDMRSWTNVTFVVAKL